MTFTVSLADIMKEVSIEEICMPGDPQEVMIS